MLLTAGERISMAVLAMAINDLGVEARSFTGSQAGRHHRRGRTARRASSTSRRAGSSEALDEGAIAIVAGFQGVTQDTKDITTLGRGGSDTTAVALAAALERRRVRDLHRRRRRLHRRPAHRAQAPASSPRITYEEMLELAAAGAKVLHLRCVEYARRFDLPIHVRSSFIDERGHAWSRLGRTEGDDMEQPIISGVAHDRSEAKVTVVGVPDKPGEAAAIFRALADAEVNIDMIVQNVSAATTGRTDITFTLPDGRRRRRRWPRSRR